jgi:hypothetical protein
VIAALDHRPRTGRNPVITTEAKTWLVALACRKAKELGYPHDEAPSNWWIPLLSSGGAERCRMSQGRRHFTDEFKREAVTLLVSSGRPLSRIASELGISTRCCATGAMEAEGGMRGRRGTRYRRRPRIPLRTRRRRFPGFVARTIGCGRSATF